MQSILVSGDPKDTENYTLKICEENKISNFDISFIKDEKPGIEQIRNLQKGIFLKPFKSKIKITIIQNAEKMTIDAQNALLKILEEPPPDTIIILTATKKDFLLPTIISRCKIIELKKETSKLSEKEIIDYQNVINSLIGGLKVGERLKLAEGFSKTKEEALSFLKNSMVIVRENLIDEILIGNQKNNLIFQYISILISFQKTYTIIYTTNVSPRLALENLFLSF
ncbi:MAG: hypothetical protein M1268_00460 [Patescibacteria group bacterium]|nr:hypothetical protein [Patescibacteria group bacterium]